MKLRTRRYRYTKGRPHGERMVTIRIRCTTEELDLYKLAARHRKQTLSEFVIDAVMDAIKRTQAPQAPQA